MVYIGVGYKIEIHEFGHDICPYQLGNKCSKETILNIKRNEK